MTGSGKCPSCRKRVDAFLLTTLHWHGTVPRQTVLFGVVCPHCEAVVGTTLDHLTSAGRLRDIRDKTD